MSLFENSAFFDFPEDFVPCDYVENVMPLSSSSSSCSFESSSSSSKRSIKQQESLTCAHCGRYVKFYVGGTFCCTFECLLGFYKRIPEEYNFAAILVKKEYNGCGTIKPAPKKRPDMSSEDFWQLMLRKHYDSSSIRFTELRHEYNSNQYIISFDVEHNKKIKN